MSPTSNHAQGREAFHKADTAQSVGSEERRVQSKPATLCGNLDMRTARTARSCELSKETHCSLHRHTPSLLISKCKQLCCVLCCRQSDVARRASGEMRERREWESLCLLCLRVGLQIVTLLSIPGLCVSETTAPRVAMHFCLSYDRSSFLGPTSLWFSSSVGSYLS